MKKFISLAVVMLLTAVFATNGQAQNRKNTFKKELQVAEALVTSETPGIDGTGSVANFQQNDIKNLLTSKELRRFRKKIVGAAYELYRLGYFEYGEYVEFSQNLGIRPRRAVKK